MCDNKNKHNGGVSGNASSAFLLFRIAFWPSAGKEPSYWFSARTVFILYVLIVRFPFPFGVCGRTWNSIVSVPDHCLFFYFVLSLSSCYDILVDRGAVFSVYLAVQKIPLIKILFPKRV